MLLTKVGTFDCRVKRFQKSMPQISAQEYEVNTYSISHCRKLKYKVKKFKNISKSEFCYQIEVDKFLQVKGRKYFAFELFFTDFKDE